MVGAEVGLVDLVLGVGVPRDLRDDLLSRSGDHRELHWTRTSETSALSRLGVVNGGGGLPAVDDLKVLDAAMPSPRPQAAELDGRGRRGDAVVVGQEQLGFVEEGLADALVDLLPWSGGTLGR